MTDTTKPESPDWFHPLKQFFETKPAPIKALAHLKEGVEISLIVDQSFHCALSCKGRQPVLEFRPAREPDVVFLISSAATARLAQSPGTEVGGLGIEVLREFKNGHVKIKVPGKMWGITTHGYLGIIKEGGSDFAKFLAQHGVSSLAKIPAIIKSLREK